MLPFPALIAPIGFYPVVPTADWVDRLLDWGVRTIQLRAKAADQTTEAVAREVRAAVEAGRRFADAQVFINDHWQQAIEHGAYGVHLGQEDLDVADLEALRRAGLRLGVSTHTPAELGRAAAVRPSYLAIGPVYPTTLKKMPYEPVGLTRLADWARDAQPFPAVAIGGISLDRLTGVMQCGVDGAAVVSAVTMADDPHQAVQQAMEIVQEHRRRTGGEPAAPQR